MAWSETPSGLLVPSIEERQFQDECEECGCTQDDACFPDEGWAEPGLCQSCAMLVV